MMKHESLKLITFRTEESTEESKKSTENRRRMDGRARTLSSRAGSGRKRKKPAGIYSGPLVPVSVSDRD